MKSDILELYGKKINVYSLNTVIVGTGAAGYNAADRLYSFEQKDIAIVTESINSGTSRNTGSDKQTYYKLTTSGNTPDSVHEMAKTLFDGGSMDGDIALVEAALSTKCFYHLTDIGVPFPHNKYGEYIGYKTDHDPRKRATSAGPLTSKLMTEKLEQQVLSKGIKIFDGYQVICILKDENNQCAVGLLALDLKNLGNFEKRYVIFNCTNIIYAVGAPAGMYANSVYPRSQTGASGIAFEAGINGKNLTESQYGIASIKFRWNLSGTYQQVLPRYISTDAYGNDEKEFLEDYFDNPGKMLDDIFLKGYQWPFDPRKIDNMASSIIDVLVYNEITIKDRKVFLDFTRNLSCASNEKGHLDFSILGNEAYEYLNNSSALFGTPFERLKHMNQPALDLYMANGIDLSREYLEIAVCAQHNNGGLCGNIWWESNIKHFFPVGEVNGSHGVYRPGGSALNSGQVGSLRAAQFIAARYKEGPMDISQLIHKAGDQVKKKLSMGDNFASNMDSKSSTLDIRRSLGELMSETGAHIRSLGSAKRALNKIEKMQNTLLTATKLSHINELPFAFKNYDLLICANVYLSAIVNYIQQGGGSRGSYLIASLTENLDLASVKEGFNPNLDKGTLAKKIQLALYKDGVCTFEWLDANPIPEDDNWFENVWNAYRNDEIIR